MFRNIVVDCVFEKIIYYFYRLLHPLKLINFFFKFKHLYQNQLSALLNGYSRDQTPDFADAPRYRDQWTVEVSRDRVEEGDLGREGVTQEIAQQT